MDDIIQDGRWYLMKSRDILTVVNILQQRHTIGNASNFTGHFQFVLLVYILG